MAERYNKNKKICMKFGTRRFSRSLMLKLETQKFRKILIFTAFYVLPLPYCYGNFT